MCCKQNSPPPNLIPCFYYLSPQSIHSQKCSFIFHFGSHWPSLPRSHPQAHIGHKVSHIPGRNSLSFLCFSSILLSMALTWHFLNIFATRYWFCTHCRQELYYVTSFKNHWGTSLEAQWLRICLPMQETRVWALVREDPTCRGATKPVHQNYWACALEPVSHNYWACVPQLLKPARLELTLCNKRSHRNKKPVHHNEEWPLLAAIRESPHAATKDPMQPKINK